MNNLAFQIYGSKKTGVFQSTWDTTLVSALGGELAAVSASGTNWALNTGATNLNVGGYKHTAGSTASLTTALTTTIMQIRQVTYTISGRTAGSITINYGGVTNSGITESSVVNVLATATTALSISPTSDFDGVVSISVKLTSSATNQIKLPLPNVGTYNIYVDWGDGTYDNITSYNSIKTLHTYPSSGIYTVRITGDTFNWQFGPPSVNDNTKIKTISSWGKLKLNTYCFFGCSNLTLSELNDIPNLSGINSFQYLFGGCSKITTIGRSNEWNTSSVTVMSNTFDSCTLFNSNISNWNVSNVTNFSQMFINATSFNNGFTSGDGVGNQLNWSINTTTTVSMSNMFQNCTAFNSNLGTGTTPWDVSKVTSFSNMFYLTSNFNNGDNLAPIGNWNISTTAPVNMTNMFSAALIFNRDIDTWNMSNVTTISGMFNRAYLFNKPLAGWERSTIGNVSTLNSVTNMINTFADARVFNQPIGNWDTSSVTIMNGMFSRTGGAGTNLFNQCIGTWNVSKVTNFTGMFYGNAGPISFNNGDNSVPMDNWVLNTSPTASIIMSYMFLSSPFNRYLGSWNTSRVISMDQMLSNTPFNNGFTSGVANQLPWDTSACTNMTSMFSNNSSFNSNLGTASTPWNVSKVTSFSQMFYGTSWNNGDNTAPINDWNIGGDASVTTVNMNEMFRGAAVFNRAIDNWNMTKVNNTSAMFGYTNNFNQSLNNWERVGSTMGNIINMSGMFGVASVFNNGFSSGVANQLSWNTSSCNNMSTMFQSANAFNSNLGTGTTPWDVSKVTSFAQMFASTLNFNNGDNTASINDWNIGGDASVGIVINMFWMFRVATAFTRLVDNWNMTKVNSTNNMFSYINYNQPLANWERTGSTLANVVNMVDMFWSNGGFNQNIGNWNVSGVTNFTGFMGTKTPSTLSSANLDAIYNNTTGWVTRGVKPNIIISFGTAKYSQAGKTGKDTLTASPNNWIIADGLLSVSTTSNNGGLIRVTTTAVHGFTASTAVYIYDVGGTTNANGTFTASVINTTQIELQSSAYNAAYTSGGKVILG
jgi:surface protein